MKTRILKTMLIFETMVIILIFVWIFFDVATGNNRTEVLREISPGGGYVLLIQELGEPSSFYAIDRLKVTLYENSSHEHYYAEFRVDVSTGGGPAEFDIEWMEDGVQIVLYGNKAQYYFLPFKTFEDANRFPQ